MKTVIELTQIEMITEKDKFTGSTEFAEEGRDRHNHRFAGVTGESIKYGKPHVHKIRTRTMLK